MDVYLPETEISSIICDTGNMKKLPKVPPSFSKFTRRDDGSWDEVEKEDEVAVDVGGKIRLTGGATAADFWRGGAELGRKRNGSKGLARKKPNG